MIGVLRNKNGIIRFLYLGGDEKKAIVINQNGDICEITPDLLYNNEIEVEEVELSDLPKELKLHIEKYKSEINDLDDIENYHKIIFRYVFDNLSRPELDLIFFQREIKGSHDGWETGNLLRNYEVTESYKGMGKRLLDDYVTTKNLYHTLPSELKKVVRMVRYKLI
jgi:hypothetical protein